DEEGTGIVHIAPGAGAEDFALSKQYGLEAIAPLDEDGTYLVGPRQGLRTGFGAFEGRFSGDVPDMVFDSLREKGILYRVQDYTHRYPTCWRCGSELVFRLVDEWFISMDGRKQEAGSRKQAPATSDDEHGTSDPHSRPLREQIMEVTRKAKWIPEFGLPRELDWLKNMHDWMISKKRYYGLALPIFECAECGRFEVIGSKSELKERAVEGWDQFEGHSPHRPYIDPVRIACSNCGGKVARIRDVGNPWLDAGIVPFSTVHYNDDPDYWRKWFPADWVSESFPGQFRNWFYALLAMGTVMVQGTEFETEPPFKSLFSYAMVRDERGEEMHKSKGNAIWFDDAAERMGADVMRWLYFRAPPANNLAFGWHPGDEIKRGFLSTLWNTYSFFVTYANIDGWEAGDASKWANGQTGKGIQRPELDRWALSELNQLVKDVTADLAGFDSMNATRRIEDFVEGLSNWYVRRSRRRFWKSEDDSDKRSAYETLWTCLETLTRLLAPFVPFLAEDIWRNLSRQTSKRANGHSPESVHLTNWPMADEALIDRDLSDSVRLVQRLASLGRSARARANVKVRQPLQRVHVKVQTPQERETVKALADQLIEELNVKEVDVIDDEAAYFDYQVRPNLPLLGPKLGSRVGELQRALASADKVSLAKTAAAGRPIELDGFTLEPTELLVTTQGKPGFAAAEEAGYAAVVTTEITPELADEGQARELVRRIQEMRKDAGFEISDRIRLTYAVDSDVARVMSSWRDYIAQETLASSVEAAQPPPGSFAQEQDVDGRKVMLAVSKVTSR
ncbi:MAG TPA: DUF5915 domain-containing protein, partial [Dehalococcoidia bacterium]